MEEVIPQTPSYLIPVIQDAARAYGVSPRLLSALLFQESGFNPKAISPAGAQGIAQFMPGTSKQYGVNAFDPQSSIEGAARYLSDMYKQFGNWEHALAAYNSGPGNVRKYQGIPPFSETQRYVKNVMSLSQQQPQSTPAVSGVVTSAMRTLIPQAQAQEFQQVAMPPQRATSSNNYTVKKGETLWGIAERLLGSGSRWKELGGYQGEPRKLPIGQVLNIPR